MNVSYNINNNSINWNIGAGYLHGSRFLTTNNQTNAAFDLNSKISVAGFDFLAEYVTTAKKSYGATPGASALSSVAQTVEIWDAGADYHFSLINMNSAVSLDYGQANLASGPDNLLKQWVAGYRIELFHNIWTGIEYSYNTNGINVSNGDLYGSGYHSSTLVLDISANF